MLEIGEKLLLKYDETPLKRRCHERNYTRFIMLGCTYIKKNNKNEYYLPKCQLNFLKVRRYAEMCIHTLFSYRPYITTCRAELRCGGAYGRHTGASYCTPSHILKKIKYYLLYVKIFMFTNKGHSQWAKITIPPLAHPFFYYWMNEETNK